MEQYQYQVLSSSRSIRLIRLLPQNASPSEDIQLTLHHVSVDEELEYAAISYAWGDLKRSERVICDEKSFAVGQNLLAALRSIQAVAKFDKHPCLWIDAICIDQSNLEERSAQVQLMRTIFSRAERVYLWLGEETDDMNAAL